MKVFIQHCDTHLFYCGAGEWTADRGRARDFKGSVLALDALQKDGLHRAQVVLSFGNIRDDVVLPSIGCAPAA